jgi:hypothetical protein
MPAPRHRSRDFFSPVSKPGPDQPTGRSQCAADDGLCDAEEEDVDDEILPLPLLRLALAMRMMSYAMSVAKPSGSGLKLELDRFRRDAEDLVREMKKEADRFIAQANEGSQRPNRGRTRLELGEAQPGRADERERQNDAPCR